MGNSQNRKSQKSHLKQYYFEVLEVRNAESSPRSTFDHRLTNWRDFEIQYTHDKLIAKSPENDLEEIPVDSDFQILSEQPEKCILTLQFHSFISQKLKTWKIKPKNPEDFTKWKKSLQRLLKFNWSASSSCQICNKAFGLLLRKHHCRRCSKCICSKCSLFRTTLPELSYSDLVRICSQCSIDVCTRRKGASDSETPNFTLIKANRNSKSEKNLVIS